ncbi:MAG: DUF1189 family protein [Candidatus Magasanikbacteria bacterium]
MYYLKAFINSFYNFNWLSNQKNEGKKAANYIVLFILMISFVSAIFLTNVVPVKLRDLRSEILKSVPEFTANIQDNNLVVTDLEQPYVFEDDELILRIDTTVSSTDFDFDEFVNGKSQDIIYFTSSSLYSYDGPSKITNITTYTDLPNKTFDKNFILEKSDQFLANKNMFFWTFLLMSFVGFSVFKLLNLLLVSLFILLINKKEEITFKQIYTLGLFALTGPSILILILKAFNYNVSFLYSILLIIILSIILNRKLNTDKVANDTNVMKVDSNT